MTGMQIKQMKRRDEREKRRDNFAVSYTKESYSILDQAKNPHNYKPTKPVSPKILKLES